MFAIFRHSRFRALPTAGLIAATSFAVSQLATAQTTAPNQWTWLGGNSVAEQAPVFGELGIPAVGNSPGGRDSAATWTDSTGNLWLYGGDDGGEFSFNDLWEYNPSTYEWAWMGGSTKPNQYAVYGSLGMAAAANNPGSRSNPARWIDKSGNVWLFGGAVFGGYIDYLGYTSVISIYPDDLWEFDHSTKQWTWMGGSGTVPCNGCGLPTVYGEIGAPAAGNTPGSRVGAVSWTDNDGSFWLFGGNAFPSQNSEIYCNDLWVFNPTTKAWAWMGGSNTGDQPGLYGTLGTPASANIPGSRSGASRWTDQSGNVWILGGLGFDASGTYGFLNDLWELDPVTKEWGWMGGSSTIPYANGSQPGVYGTLGVPAAGNTPGGTFSGSNQSWTDSNGNLWLLAEGLWEFLPSTKQWAWMGGSSVFTQPGVYGTLGTPAPANYPQVRSEALTWADSNGNFWLFGGGGNTGDLDDLWGYQPSSTPSFPVTATPVFSPSGGVFSAGQLVSISDSTPGAAFYYTTDGSTPTFASTEYTGPFQILGDETVRAIAVAVNYQNSALASAAYTTYAPPDFTFAATTTMIIAPRSSGLTTVVVTPEYGFSAPVSFTCSSGLPSGATCSFSPATAAPPTYSTTVTASVPATSSALRRNTSALLPGTALAALVCCFGLRRRSCLRFATMLLLALSIADLGLCTGCGKSSGGTNPPIIEPVTYTVTLTGTSGTLSHTSTFLLTVTN